MYLHHKDNVYLWDVLKEDRSNPLSVDYHHPYSLICDEGHNSADRDNSFLDEEGVVAYTVHYVWMGEGVVSMMLMKGDLPHVWRNEETVTLTLYNYYNYNKTSRIYLLKFFLPVNSKYASGTV